MNTTKIVVQEVASVMDLGATVVTHRVIRIHLVLTNTDVNILILFKLPLGFFMNYPFFSF